MFTITVRRGQHPAQVFKIYGLSELEFEKMSLKDDLGINWSPHSCKARWTVSAWYFRFFLSIEICKLATFLCELDCGLSGVGIGVCGYLSTCIPYKKAKAGTIMYSDAGNMTEEFLMIAQRFMLSVTYVS